MGRQVKERLGETQGTSGGSIWICSRPESPGKIQQGCWKICEPTSSAEEVQCFSASCLPWGHCHGYSLAGAHCERQTQHADALMEVRVKGELSQLRARGPQSTMLSKTHKLYCHTQPIYSFIIYLTHWNECSLRIETAFLFAAVSSMPDPLSEEQ